jgi:hypothetical protein
LAGHAIFAAPVLAYEVRCVMPSPDPGTERQKDLQQIERRITEINAEYAYLMAMKIGDGETVRKIHRLRVERSDLNLRNRGS